MFDFENLVVYKKSKIFHRNVIDLIFRIERLDSVTKNQLRRAALSVVLNIAEGSSRFSKPDRRNYSVISRGSIFECVAIIDILKDTGLLSAQDFYQLYSQAEEISKILFTMIKNLEKKNVFTTRKD